MNRIAKSAFCIAALMIVASCSRPDHLRAEELERDAAANRFERIDQAIAEGKSYRLINVSEALSKVGNKNAVDRLLLIARHPDEGVRNVVLIHSESLPTEQALRVLNVLAESEDGTAAKARQRLNSRQSSKH